MKNKFLATFAGVVLLAAVSVVVFMCPKAGKMQSLKTTDPEFLAMWDNFITNDVLPKNTLDAKTRYRVILAASIATQGRALFEQALSDALDGGLSAVEAKEVIYHAVPYVGFSKVYDFILAANRIMERRGVKTPLEGQATTTPDTRKEKGFKLQSEIFGERIAKAYETSPKDLIHIQEFLSANCFGDYYTRSGADVKTRELLTFVMLVSMGGAEPQAKGHVQGNVNVGNGRDVLIAAVTQILPYIGYPRSLNAIAAINAVVPTSQENE